MVCMNMSLINWYSKRQSIIKRSMFGTVSVPMKVVVEMLHVIRYMLRMIGIPISGPTYVYGNNMPVIHNALKQESKLKKKCNKITFHTICKSVEMRESLTR